MSLVPHKVLIDSLSIWVLAKRISVPPDSSSLAPFADMGSPKKAQKGSIERHVFPVIFLIVLAALGCSGTYSWSTAGKWLGRIPLHPRTAPSKGHE
jgi:hypothetical protein